MSSQPVFRSYKKRKRQHPLFLAICGCIVFSAGAAGIWHFLSPAPPAPAIPTLDPAIAKKFSDAASPEEAPAPAVTPSEEVTSSAAEPSEAAPPAPPSTETVGALPEQPRVRSEYFDDAVFVGDSLTTGIKLYDVMSNTTVLAATGIGLESIFTKEAIKIEEQSYTIPDALGKITAKKVYIMLGANSLWGEQSYLIEQYGKILDVLREKAPDAIFYVQSVLPINPEIFATKYKSGISNADIASFNTALSALAAEKNCYYLDVASVFCDENGAMPAEYTPDGMHIRSAQYIMWFDYLKTHAITQ